MSSPSRPLGTVGTASNCAQAAALATDQDDEQILIKAVELRPATPNYDFLEQPSQDFFCCVTMELLMDPQQTSCCGNHVSPEAFSRQQREGKACPMCNEQRWTVTPDKYHRRRVRTVRVRCPHGRSGCDWEGEVGGLERHTASCPKRPWECPHCALRCLYGEGEGKHWPVCSKFPEPCPNGCEVGSVERCHLEQHHRECPLEPVACEMGEFGCSAVVPRKDLATHMRESELQHLTAMAVLNLRLTSQLQQDAAEKDEKIAHLQMEMTEQKEELKQNMTYEMSKHREEFKKNVTYQNEALMTVMMQQKEQLAKEITNRKEELKKEMSEQNEELKKEMSEQLKKEMSEQNEELKKEMSEQNEELKKEMSEQQKELGLVLNRLDQLKVESHEVKEGVAKLNTTAHHIAVHTAGDCDVCRIITVNKYSEAKGTRGIKLQDEFYYHKQGYKFSFAIFYFDNNVFVVPFLKEGECDDQLLWPVKVKVRVELLNQAGDHHHVERSVSWECEKEKRGDIRYFNTADCVLQYHEVEKKDDGVRYLMNDCLQFRFHFTVQAARLPATTIPHLLDTTSHV